MKHVRGFWSGRRKNTPHIGWADLIVPLFVLTGCSASGGQNAPGAEPASPVTAFLGQIEQDLAGLTGTKPAPPATVPAPDPPQGKQWAKPWGAETAWRTDFTADSCPRGSTGGACLLQVMAREHASVQAVAFARKIGLNGYLGEFHAYGRVDLGVVTYPFFANDNQTQISLKGSKNGHAE